MKDKPTVTRLPSPEHCGDWHDKPLRWLVAANNNIQKFATKKDATTFARLWRKYGYLDAIKAYAALP